MNDSSFHLEKNSLRILAAALEKLDAGFGGHSLGHAMAREIGLLLLGVQSHSPTGLMRARWGRSDLLRGATGWQRPRKS